MTDPAMREDRRHHLDSMLMRESLLDLGTLPFERVLLDLLDHARLLKRFQIINGRKPEPIMRALSGEHVGTIVYAD